MESLVFRGLHPGDVRSVLCGSPSVFLSSQVGIQYESALTLICKHKNSIQIRINKCDTCPCNVSVFCDKFYYKHIHTQKGNLLAAAAKSLQSCPTLCNPIDGSPPGSSVLGDSPGKNTGVGCHFLLQCMKVTSESLSVVSDPQ